MQNISLFCRALLQKRPVFLRSPLIVATPYQTTSKLGFQNFCLDIAADCGLQQGVIHSKTNVCSNLGKVIVGTRINTHITSRRILSSNCCQQQRVVGIKRNVIRGITFVLLRITRKKNEEKKKKRKM